MSAKTCTTPDCDQPVRCRKMCRRHYQEWWVANRDPNKVGKRMDVFDRVMRRVVKDSNGCCCA